MPAYWVVWYYSYVQAPICCGTYVWVPCLISWARNRIIHDRIRGEVNIPCPNYQWHQSLMPFDLINIIGIKEFEKINDLYTDLYITNTDDMRKCPNEKWNYAGFILLESCNQPLKCIECNTTWRDYAQMTKFRKWIKSVKETINFKSETFSYINEVLTGSPWPKCGMVIWKDGGWDHMVCQKCKFEFCWLCLGHYPGYRHTEMTFWPIRKMISVLMTIYLFIALDLKICTIFPKLGYFQSSFLYWIGYIIPPNIFGLWFFFEFALIGICSDWFRDWANSWQKMFRIPWVLAWIAYPIAYFYLWYKMWWSDHWCFMIKVIFYEVIVIACLFFGFWLCYFLIYLFIAFIFPFIWKIVMAVYTKIAFVFNKIMSVFGAGIALFIRCRKFFYLTSKEKQRDSIVKNIHKNKKKKKGKKD